MDLFDEYFKGLATAGNCVQMNSKRRLKCNCLGILTDEKLRDAVSRFALNFGERTRSQRMDTAVDWCRYAKPTAQNNICFLIPYDSNRNAEVQEALHEEKVCVSALLNICCFGRRPWKLIRQAALCGVMAPKHGNTGKHNRKRGAENPMIRRLHDHFKELLGWSEVQATRLVREVTGQVMERDSSDGNRYLPTAMTKRHCHRRYCADNGATATTDAKGWTSVSEDPNSSNTYQECVAWSVYWSFWGDEYPYLKVNRPSEDICGYCFRFSNRHKYRTNPSSTPGPGTSTVSYTHLTLPTICSV